MCVFVFVCVCVWMGGSRSRVSGYVIKETPAAKCPDKGPGEENVWKDEKSERERERERERETESLCVCEDENESGGVSSKAAMIDDSVRVLLAWQCARSMPRFRERASSQRLWFSSFVIHCSNARVPLLGLPRLMSSSIAGDRREPQTLSIVGTLSRWNLSVIEILFYVGFFELR